MAGAAPAGWYPQEGGGQRYWDGTRWTGHLAPANPARDGTQELVPVGGRTQSPVAPQEAELGYEPPFNRDDPRWNVPGLGPTQPTTLPAQAPGRWHPDPFRRHELRWWDGRGWTHHVASQGRQAIDPPAAGMPSTAADRIDPKIQQQVRSLGLLSQGAQAGVGPLFTERILVVNQKPKIFEVKAEYGVFDQHGRQIAAVRQIGENFMRKAMAVTPDRNRTRRLEIVDLNGLVLMKLVRPANVVKSTVEVSGADGSALGEIVQENTRALSGLMKGAVGIADRFSPVNLEHKIGHLGNLRFSLQARGRKLGSIQIEDREQWDFRIEDEAGAEIARITRTWAGAAKEWFTKADNYVVQIHRPLDQPLNSLTVAAALAVDTVFRQDA